MATSTRSRYQGIINNYLLPAFGKLGLHDLETLQRQRYFSAMTSSKLAEESSDKIEAARGFLDTKALLQTFKPRRIQRSRALSERG